MAPVESAEDTHANKRKRETDEHGKRKRARRHRRTSKAAPTNGKLSKDATTSKVNGVNGSTTPSGDLDSSNNSNTKANNDNASIANQETQQLQVEAEENGQASEDQLSTWKVSKPMGGRMLNIDPILTQDEKYLIIAYNTSIQVYSAAESLLVRKIPLLQLDAENVEQQIVSICLSPSSPNIVWVASSAGHLWSINWTNGDGAEFASKVKCRLLCDMSIEPLKIGSKFRDVPFVSVEKHGTWQIIACDIQGYKMSAHKTLLNQVEPILDLRSIRNGYALIASSERNVLFGRQTAPAVHVVSELEYEFFTLNGSDEITSLDVRVTDRVHLNQKSQAEAGDAPVVEIVVGCARGAVFFYNDLIPQLYRLHSSKGHRNSLQPRKYHWHRKAVHAVKWSRDGNYIISGGSESTLVLWQLDTHKMDFLPHLSATIENIVVSERGSAYVVHLDDNSVIILSTAEMKPSTYISGIQTLTYPQPLSKDDIVRRVGQNSQVRLLKTPAAINPADSSRIHFCVGNGQQISQSRSGPSIPLIQTIDLTTLQGVSKQALTRTNPTDNNMTAKGYAITEPRITGMTYSADGKWLATTDEWQPPTRDVDSLEGSPAERREVFLKFWAVSPEDQNLELVSRINAPHYTGRSEPIYGLAADPNVHRFASIGEDGVVRLWEPTVRQRDGVLVKGKMDRQLYSWACSRAIYLQENEEPLNSDAIAVQAFLRGSGAVTFSEDGSTLVCAIGTIHSSAVHVIDTESGKIRNSIDGLITGDVRDIKIISSTMVVLSDRLMVYDLVSDELLYGVQLRTSEDPHNLGASILTHMAVDYRTSTFAVAVSRGKLNSQYVNSELAIFKPDQSEPELVRQFPHPIVSVVAAVGYSGYLVLDSAAQLWSVSEGMDVKSLAFAQPLVDLNLDQVHTEELPEDGTTFALLAGDDDEIASGDEMDVDIPEDAADEASPVVIAPQRLAELFDTAPAFAMPPIEDMFYQVTKLFSANSAVPA
ncbi:sporulation protein [Annulohypoxylon maeteangense]|uniref:sporulation protein n=1 Tax=Annulohypoxylon maeteangense TaxID=1927788 RepID=UPI00200875AA|nr:sporulation protein [Annulohypoxylon maeteangense]KAI0881227.1 sporulation protein [Annulohypoxylon maeteangense]